MTPAPAVPPRFTLNLNRGMVLLAIVFFPLLLALGFWQLDRAQQKRDILQQIQQRQASSPVDLNETTLASLPSYTRVIAQGEFDNRHIWLVDNRQRDGQPGFEVVQIFILSSGQRLLVNRGWLKANPTRAQLPEIPLVGGSTSLFAQLYPVSQHPLLSAQGETPSWPRIITEIDIAVMAADVGQSLNAALLKLDDASPAALRTGWQAVNMTPERHTAYAVQWFGLALALAVLTLFANSNLATLWRFYRHKNTTNYKP